MSSEAGKWAWAAMNESGAEMGQEATPGRDWRLVAAGAVGVAAVAGLGYLTYSALSGAKQPTQEPAAEAKAMDGQALKEKGNNLFKMGQYGAAIKAYTEALASGGEMATFYQNRAAAHEKLGQTAEAEADCDAALAANPRYAKAYARRGRLRERQGRADDALRDFTAACILDNFSNYANMTSADRVLKTLSEEKARDLFQRRATDAVPLSTSFVDSYLQSFCEDPFLNSLSEDVPLESPLHSLKSKFKSKDYVNVLPELNRLLTLPSLSDQEKLEVVMLRATFGLMQGNEPEASGDFKQAFALLKEMPQSDYTKKMLVNGLVKRGSFYMQQGKREECLGDFEEAEKIDASNADIFHHRGQLLMLMGEPQKAAEDFARCVAARPDFALARVQAAFAEYRAASMSGGSLAEAHAGILKVEREVEELGDCAEGWALLGQVYMERQNWDGAEVAFDRALRLAPANANIHVHKGLLHLQRSDGDLEAAKTEMSKALDTDPHCQFAFETLGTLEVQRGNIQPAMEFFDKAVALARTELEVTHLVSLKEAALTQVTVSKSLGIQLPTN